MNFSGFAFGAPWLRGAWMRLQGLGSFLVSVGSLGASF